MLRDSIWWVIFVVWAGLLFLEPGIPAGFGVMFFGKLFVAASVLALGIVWGCHTTGRNKSIDWYAVEMIKCSDGISKRGGVPR